MVSGQMFSCFISPVPLTGACDNAAAMSGILMRKLEEVGGSSIFSVWELDDEVSSGKSADDGDSVNLSISSHFIRKYQSQVPGRVDTCLPYGFQWFVGCSNNGFEISL